jgi:serine/threonine protein kinase
MSESVHPLATSQSAPHGVDALHGTPYRTLGALGAGGMGEVVEAEHVELQRRVVVKLLHQQFAADPKLVDRMRVEARTLAALAHPNVVTVTDFGWTPGRRVYFVMERLYGRTLRAELDARGALPVAEAIGYVRQVLAGLSAAHRLGIVHRDVKVENIFLCDRAANGAAVVKVLDFGIAKVLRGPGPSRAPTPQYPTQEGVLLGTPRCVAPEQALCQPVDARTDIYGVGILLYTLVVGSGPFSHARDQAALLMAHVKEAPAYPSSGATQPIPPLLDRAILRALAKRPEHRFQSAEEFSEELGRVLLDGASTTQPLAPVAGVAAQPPAAPRPAAPAAEQAPAARSGLVSSAAGSEDSRQGVPTERPRSRGWVFVVALIASTAFFSVAIAVASHVWGARP